MYVGSYSWFVIITFVSSENKHWKHTGIHTGKIPETYPKKHFWLETTLPANLFSFLSELFFFVKLYKVLLCCIQVLSPSYETFLSSLAVCQPCSIKVNTTPYVWVLEPKGSTNKSRSHIDAPHARQPLVKGERLVRYALNAVMIMMLWTQYYCI